MSTLPRRILRGSLACLFACATLLVAQSTISSNAAAAPAPILLWPNGAPGAVGDTALDKPILTPYLPAQNPTHTAIVVCPGGGYSMLAIDKEGTQIAHWLNDRGVAAFVLTYRYGPQYHHPIPLLDAQRAIRYVRSHANEDSVDPGRIGIMGFSAGGHLASTAGTHFDNGNPDATDPIEHASSRPDFMVLAYPVISMQSGITHNGSLHNLLGGGRTRCSKTSSPMKPRSRRKLRRPSSSAPPTMRRFRS
ncbi:MAG TPA: alpha/beta hydrolase [Acidobacteriaceae bacterium]|nr:alpha/beta hydrolase [Acidobacteriaceae bacterium]